MMSEIIIVGFLPILSDKGPATNAPTNAPSYVKETIISIYSFLISGKSSTKYNCAPAIIPVSYPNSSPPIDAIIIRRSTNDLL